MSKLTRGNFQWKSGVMLGWNSSGKMAGILRHPNSLPGAQQPLEQQELFRKIKVPGSSDKNRVLISSFFPHSSGGGGASTGNGNSQRPATARPRSRKFLFEPQKDFSPEFLEYLRSLSKRDFEHAVEQDAQNNAQVKPGGTSTDKNNNVADEPINSVSGVRSKSRLNSPRRSGGNNINLINGYQFFGSNSSSTSTAVNLRPSTVPRYLARRDGGRRGDSFINKGVLRSMGPSPAGLDETGNIKGRPLTKVKLTPSQVENVASRSSQGDTSSVKVDEVLAASISSSFTGSLSDSERPSSSASSSGSKRVTFAADVVSYDRESKPSKRRKFPKRRRQGFPHPSRGIFVPPELEIVESTGPTGSCKDNLYLNFNQVWTHPAARTTGESNASRVTRQERFHRIMNDLEHAHIHYNRLVSFEQNDYLINAIFKRYILVLDLALMEGHLVQVEHLLDTISKSIPVLQQNTFYYLYGPTIIKDMDENKASEKKDVEHPDLVLTSYALARISDNLPRHETTNMSIETVLVKLCLELVELVFSQYGSYEFRSALSTLPFTVRQAINLLKELRTSKDAFCYIKWVNNSAVQRDYRSILKNLGLLDRYGCKADISSQGPSGKLDGVITKRKIKQNPGHVTSSKRSKAQPPPMSEGTHSTTESPSRGNTP